MRLEKNLNLAIQLSIGWLHSTPISYAVFEKYFLPISKVFTQIYSEGLGSMAGPRVSYLMLKKVSQQDGTWEGPEGVEKGLMNEIYRLSNVFIPGEQGWETLPLYEAFRLNKLDDEEKAEVNNALVFFTLVSCMHRAAERIAALTLMTKLWGGEITSLDCTAYMNSLPISTTGESIGEKVTP